MGFLITGTLLSAIGAFAPISEIKQIGVLLAGTIWLVAGAVVEALNRARKEETREAARKLFE